MTKPSHRKAPAPMAVGGRHETPGSESVGKKGMSAKKAGPTENTSNNKDEQP